MTLYNLLILYHNLLPEEVRATQNLKANSQEIRTDGKESGLFKGWEDKISVNLKAPSLGLRSTKSFYGDGKQEQGTVWV